jgi:hypothetical protein
MVLAALYYISRAFFGPPGNGWDAWLYVLLPATVLLVVGVLSYGVGTIVVPYL